MDEMRFCAASIDADSFTAMLRIRGDSRVARIRVGWMAIGELHGEDDWEIY